MMMDQPCFCARAINRCCDVCWCAEVARAIPYNSVESGHLTTDSVPRKETPQRLQNLTAKEHTEPLTLCTSHPNTRRATHSVHKPSMHTPSNAFQISLCQQSLLAGSASGPAVQSLPRVPVCHGSRCAARVARGACAVAGSRDCHGCLAVMRRNAPLQTLRTHHFHGLLHRLVCDELCVLQRANHEAAHHLNGDTVRLPLDHVCCVPRALLVTRPTPERPSMTQHT